MYLDIAEIFPFHSPLSIVKCLLLFCLMRSYCMLMSLQAQQNYTSVPLVSWQLERT